MRANNRVCLFYPEATFPAPYSAHTSAHTQDLSSHKKVPFFLLEHIRKNYSVDVSSLITESGGGSERCGALAVAGVPAALAAAPQTPASQCHSCCCHQPRKHMTPTSVQSCPHQLPVHPRRAEACCWSGAAHVCMDGWIFFPVSILRERECVCTKACGVVRN